MKLLLKVPYQYKIPKSGSNPPNIKKKHLSPYSISLFLKTVISLPLKPLAKSKFSSKTIEGHPFNF
jgi:hypothetical protein